MVFVYLLKLEVTLKELPNDIQQYAMGIVEKIYADYKIGLVEQKGKTIIVTFTAKVGAEINNHDSCFRFMFSDEIREGKIKNFNFLECYKYGEKSPNYFAYLAKNISKSEEPLSYEKFYEEIAKGKYWEDI